MKLSGCKQSANVPILRTSSLSSATEINDDGVGEGNAKKQTSSDSEISYSAVVVCVWGGELDAHPSAKKPKEVSKNRKNIPSQDTNEKREPVEV